MNSLNITNPIVSFKGIELSNSEREKSEYLFDKLSSNPSNKDSELLTGEIFDVFNKHLEYEVKVKGKKLHILEQDLLQAMYLRFFENLELVKEKLMNLQSFIKSLNDFAPTKNEVNPEHDIFRYSLDSLPKDYREAKGTRLTDMDLPVYSSRKNEAERKNNKNLVTDIANASNIHRRSAYILEEVINDKSDMEIAEGLNVGKSWVSKIKNRAIRQIQKEKGTLPPEFLEAAERLQHNYKLDVPIDKIINSIIRDLCLLNSDDVIKRIDDTATLVGIKPKAYATAVITQPSLFYFEPKALEQNIKTNAQYLEISNENYVKIALDKPNLFYIRLETLQNNVVYSAKVLNISEKMFIKTALKRPQLFSLKPETISKNVETTSALLGVQKELFLKSALRMPQLLYQSSETINQCVENSAGIFKISKSEFVKMALSQPSLFYMKSETLKTNVDNFSSIFNLSSSEALNIAKRKPQIILQNPNTLMVNAENFMRIFKISKEEYLKLAQNFPDLFVRQPEILYNNIKNLSKISNVPVDVIIKRALSCPTIFCQKPESVLEKEKIKQFSYKVLSSKDYELFSSSLRTVKKEALFENILKQLLKKELKLKVMASDKILLSTLKSSTVTDFEFKVPEHEIVNEFKDFVLNYFSNNLNDKRCVFKTLR